MMRYREFPNVSNMLQAFADNYEHDPNTFISCSQYKEPHCVITWFLGDQFRRGEGNTIVEAIADFYDTEMPPEEKGI